MTDLVSAGPMALCALASGYAALTVYRTGQAVAAASPATVGSLRPASGTSSRARDGWVR